MAGGSAGHLFEDDIKVKTIMGFKIHITPGRLCFGPFLGKEMTVYSIKNCCEVSPPGSL